MTITSKFRFEYIAAGILGWAFVLFMANLFAVLIYSLAVGHYEVLTEMNFENFEFTSALLIILIVVSAACYILYFIFGWKLLKITVTENEVVVKNIFTGSSKQITYDEIANIDGHLQMNTHGGYMPRPSNAGRSAIRTRVVTLMDGFTISYNNNTYENFRQIDDYIQANFYKIR